MPATRIFAVHKALVALCEKYVAAKSQNEALALVSEERQVMHELEYKLWECRRTPEVPDSSSDANSERARLIANPSQRGVQWYRLRLDCRWPTNWSQGVPENWNLVSVPLEGSSNVLF